MSWEIFRKNILNISLRPENINNTDIIAKAYAREYDLAVKRGGDIVNKVPLQKGNVEAMEAYIKKALDNGLNYNEKYDLVGEMGKGVLAYWSPKPAPTPLLPTNPNQPPPGSITMNVFPIPLVTIEQLTSGVTGNIVVYSNIVTNPGKWIKPLAAININNQSTNNNASTGGSGSTAAKLDKNTTEKILFVGDSISAIKSVSGEDMSWVYPAYIKKSLPNASVDVLAIPAKQTKWMLENLPNQLASTKYNRVYIYGGVNDMFSGISISTAVNNVQKMVDLINESGANAFVILGYNTENMDYTKMATTVYVKNKADYLPMIEKYKNYQTELSNKITNAKFVGIFDIGTLGDGFHPSAVQARQIANIIINAL
jgi:lysophospholipase L1-like esterase